MEMLCCFLKAANLWLGLAQHAVQPTTLKGRLG